MVSGVSPSWDTTGAAHVAKLQAALTAGGYVRGVPGSTYYLNAPLVIGAVANTTLDMTGCTINGVAAAAVSCLLLDIGHHNVLNSVAWGCGSEAMTAGQGAAKTGLAPPTVSTTLSKLAKRGEVQRPSAATA